MEKFKRLHSINSHIKTEKDGARLEQLKTMKELLTKQVVDEQLRPTFSYKEFASNLQEIWTLANIMEDRDPEVSKKLRDSYSRIHKNKNLYIREEK